MSKIKLEPIIAWFTAHVVLNGAQITVSGLPKWVHLAILVLSTISAGYGARRQVTPVAKTATRPRA